jgi:hypothetical protein
MSFPFLQKALDTLACYSMALLVKSNMLVRLGESATKTSSLNSPVSVREAGTLV